MIYDNYDNPQISGNADSSAVDIRRFLPGSNHGSIIITTRSAQVSQGQRLHVQKLLNEQEGLEILLNTSGQKDIQSSMLKRAERCKIRIILIRKTPMY